jgi:hypothetical protein
MMPGLRNFIYLVHGHLEGIENRPFSGIQIKTSVVRPWRGVRIVSKKWVIGLGGRPHILQLHPCAVLVYEAAPDVKILDTIRGDIFNVELIGMVRV